VENTNLTPEQAIEKINNSVAEKMLSVATKDDFEALKNDVKTISEKANTEDLKLAVAKLEGKLESLNEKAISDNNEKMSLGGAIIKAYNENINEIKTVKNNGGLISLDVKAVGTMTIGGNYSGGTVGLSDLEQGLTRIQRRRAFLRSLVNVAGISSKYAVWIEQANPEGGAGMTAEGSEKSQADFDLVERSKDVKKVSAWIKVSKEMVEDIPFMEGEINNELIELVQLKLDQQILSGNGTGNNLSGIDSYATSWTAGNFANTIHEANNSDVLRVGIAQIRNADFVPNYILMNPEDVASMELSKASNGEYTYPMWVESGEGISKVVGVPVVENSGVTADNFIIGDFTKSNLRMRQDITVQVGFVNDDFTKNLMTVLAEVRAVHFIKTNHTGAFVKGVFSTSKTALETP